MPRGSSVCLRENDSAKLTKATAVSDRLNIQYTQHVFGTGDPIRSTSIPALVPPRSLVVSNRYLLPAGLFDLWVRGVETTVLRTCNRTAAM